MRAAFNKDTSIHSEKRGVAFLKTRIGSILIVLGMLVVLNGCNAYDIMSHGTETREGPPGIAEDEHIAAGDEEPEVDYIGSVSLFCGGKVYEPRVNWQHGYDDMLSVSGIREEPENICDELTPIPFANDFKIIFQGNPNHAISEEELNTAHCIFSKLIDGEWTRVFHVYMGEAEQVYSNEEKDGCYTEITGIESYFELLEPGEYILDVNKWWHGLRSGSAFQYFFRLSVSAPTPADGTLHNNQEVDLQEQLTQYLSELCIEAYGPHYHGLRFRISNFEESIEGNNYTSTFLWTMFNLGNGLDVPSDYGVEQQGNWHFQLTAKIANDGKLDLSTAIVLADDSVTGPPTYRVPIAEFFPPPPATPPVGFERIKEYAQTYMQHISDGDATELARFLLIDGGVQDRYVRIAERVIEYYKPYDISGAEVQRVYYFDDELGRRYIALVRDGSGEMFRIDLCYGDGLAGIDVRMFE